MQARSISAMTSPCATAVAASRSVAEANQEIRDFMTARAGRPLWPEEQAVYEGLLAAWAVAARNGSAASA